MLYAIERIWEMFVYQTNVLFFTRLRNCLMTTENDNSDENESVQSEEKVTRKIKVVTYIRLYLQRER